MKFIRYIFAALLVLCIFYFGRTPQNLLVGRWQSNSDSHALIEFTENGSCLLPGANTWVRYQFIDGNKIKIELPEQPTVELLAISTTALKTRNEKTGMIEEFRRVR